MEIYGVAPIAVFATDTHALLFLDSDRGRWFLANMYNLGHGATLSMIEQVLEDQGENPDLNYRPDGTLAQSLILVSRDKATLPDDFPVNLFVGTK